MLDTVDGIENDVDTNESANEGEGGETTYEPNSTYTVLGEEKQFDDRFSGLLTSKENEDALRDLHERADGLDHYKNKFSSKETEFNTLHTSNAKMLDDQRELDFLKKTNQGKYFERLGVDPMDYALKEIEREDMDDNQRQLHDDSQRFNEEAERLRLQNETLQNQNREFSNQQSAERFDMAMNTDEVRKLQELVPDFKDQVRQVGQAHFAANKQDMTFASAIETVSKRYRGFTANAPAASNGNQPATPQGGGRTRIPNVSGSSGSPQERTINSLDDLREVIKQKMS